MQPNESIVRSLESTARGMRNKEVNTGTAEMLRRGDPGLTPARLRHAGRVSGLTDVVS